MTVLGDGHRARLMACLATVLPEAAGQPPLWPGEGLLPPPADPPAMPYCPGRPLQPA